MLSDGRGKRFLRAHVTGFTFFGLGVLVHKDDPFIFQNGHASKLGVVNATTEVLQLVLVSASYASNTLPEDSTPASIRLQQGAQTFFETPSGCTQARLLVATVEEIPHSRAITVKYYGNQTMSDGGKYTFTDALFALGNNGGGTAAHEGLILQTVFALAGQ